MNDFKENNKYEYDYPHMQQFGQRRILKYDVDQGIKLLDYARENYQKGKLSEAFDIYEQLSIAYPRRAIEILSELYDQYKKLKNIDRYSLYQCRFFNFCIKATDKVLDVGSGNIPFHLATHLVDITTENEILISDIDGNYFLSPGLLKCRSFVRTHLNGVKTKLNQRLLIYQNLFLN